MKRELKLPLNTYRLQMTPQFGFKEAARILPYLKELGITDLYISPIFNAREGSTHGYDVTNPLELNPQLGSEDEFWQLARQSRQYGFGWVQDIVPNHMAFSRQNPFLMDVLENGQSSEYADFFDIYWNHHNESLRGRILAPFLGRFLGECLKAGEIDLSFDEDGFFINYYTLKFPMRIETYEMVLERCISRLKEKTGGVGSEWVRFMGALYLIRDLAHQEIKDKQAYTGHIKKSLFELYGWSTAVKESIDSVLGELNVPQENPLLVEAMEKILQKQAFRLSFWKISSEEISFRRFFNINELICVRVEDEKIFTQSHAKILELCKNLFTALRIDHIDGLYDPYRYLKRLEKRSGRIPMYVEKILAQKEQLPFSWPVEGTTGYDFMNHLNALYCDKSNLIRINRIYKAFCGQVSNYCELEYEKKRMIVRKNMAGDVDNLAHQLKAIASQDIYGSDITMEGLKSALVEIMAYLKVYRTYITKEGISRSDKEYWDEAFKKALARTPDFIYVIGFIKRCLLERESFSETLQDKILEFIHRLQQFTGPVTAKGIEDTLLYSYNRLLSLNEVGGFPDSFGVHASDFHAFIKKRQYSTPRSFNATSTHDTKRGEDLRARLNVISEIPEEWEKYVKSWQNMNKLHKTTHEKREIPDRNDEYSLYQTLSGTLPEDWERLDDKSWKRYRDRISGYILKSIREAKIHTEWIKPDDRYESGYLKFIELMLNRESGKLFLNSLNEFASKLRFYGFLNSLSQTILKGGIPGVCDIYQGSEGLNLSLVDPDNRRKIDFINFESMIKKLPSKKEDLPAWLKARYGENNYNAVKLYITRELLKLRNNHTDLFLQSTYIPLYPTGKYKEHIIAFKIEKSKSRIIVIGTRLMTNLYEQVSFPSMPGIEECFLELDGEFKGSYINVFDGKEFTGNKIDLKTALETLPGAVLVAQ